MFFYQYDNLSNFEQIDPELYIDFIFPLHLHSDMEMVMMRRRKLDLQLRDREERLYLGDLALTMPRELHGYCTADTSEIFICMFSQDYVDIFAQSTKGFRGRQRAFHTHKV